jgi:hypothetical protein
MLVPDLEALGPLAIRSRQGVQLQDQEIALRTTISIYLRWFAHIMPFTEMNGTLSLKDPALPSTDIPPQIIAAPTDTRTF